MTTNEAIATNDTQQLAALVTGATFECELCGKLCATGEHFAPPVCDDCREDDEPTADYTMQDWRAIDYVLGRDDWQQKLDNLAGAGRTETNQRGARR